ncbi:MAG: type II toxin-antitoxin system RelE/ParE family toxin [Methanocalculus sp. MSAO_Arc2]|uniref:type II toxin-antitoxin system RelE family toxin n=1 Tax=Methanocalculus sp. MSAO_Arc2 TaxID=2293855 RepID=UPI000FEFC80B|nr:MAG: type II toxin-antitoxin system RelE/ParE family toxin [Methanocalculus sp. MSAO_Arc2]
MIWRVFFTPIAERELKRLSKPGIQRIKDELKALAEEAYPRHHVKKLKSHQNNPMYSYRVGRYRIILTIENGVMVIFVIEIGDRYTVY